MHLGRDKRFVAGVGERHARLQCFVVFISAIKPKAADSDHDTGSGDHKFLGDVVHAPSLGGYIWRLGG